MYTTTKPARLCIAYLGVVLCLTLFGSSMVCAQEVIIVDDHSTPTAHPQADSQIDSEHHVPIENDRVRPKNLQYQLVTLEQRKRSQRHPVFSMLAGGGFFLIGLPMLVHGIASEEGGLAIASLVPLGLSALFFVVGGLFFGRNRRHNKRLEMERQQLLHPNISFSPTGFALHF